jgi:Cytochrome P460
MSHPSPVNRLVIRSRLPGPQIEVSSRLLKSLTRRIGVQKYLLTIIVGLGLTASGVYLLVAKPVAAAQPEQSSVVYDSQGKVQVPDPHVFRRWVFVGAPLTPNGLNTGKFNCNEPGGCTTSNFPEYHHVYIEQKNVDAYLKTGSFPEGTVIVKELTRVLNPTFPDGSRKEPSGRGYFNGAYNGIDMSIKDSKRYAKTNGWGYYTFGHRPLPYAATAAESPVSDCAGCHLANVASTDMTWIQFYPILRDKDPTK